MEEATYFHATPYRFESQAFNEIIRRFNTILQDVSARCWYDVHTDIFRLDCPSGIGSRATSVLGEVMKGYIAEELASAAQNDRAPTVQPFAESAWLGSGPEEGGPAAQMEDPTISQPLVTEKPIILHVINLENSQISSIKVFKPGELPNGLVERVLTSNEGTFTLAMKQGVTARAVKWNESREEHNFNGRFGLPIHVEHSANAHLIHTSTFTTLSDQRASANTIEEDDDFPIKTWNFKSGHNPDIRAFIQGMGETEMVDPETVPEKPEDAAIFLAHSALPATLQGRPRVPKGMVESEASEGKSESEDGETGDEEEDEEDQSTSQGRPADSVLELFGHKRETVLVTSNPVFPHNQRKIASTPSVREPRTISYDPYDTKGTNRSSSGKNGTSTQFDLPTYDRKYAAVDKIGLGGVATNQATWEHENLPSRKATTNRSGLSRRSIPTTIHPASVSGTGTADTPPRSASARSHTPTQSASDAGSMPQAWAYNVNRPSPGAEKLVDDSSGPPVGTTRPPPGYNLYSSGGSTSTRDTPIVERLQKNTDHRLLKRNTMNQKKGKGQKASSKVVLPKPDPPPAPRPRASESSKARITPEVSATPSKAVEPTPPSGTAELLHAIPETAQGAIFRADFGLILMRHLNDRDFFNKGAGTKEKLQTKLRAESGSLQSTFFPRLTTSVTDALYLLDLAPQSPVTATVGYEIVVKTAEGSLRTIKHDQSARDRIQGFCPETILGEIFMHYPIRVWDAKVTITRSRLDGAMVETAGNFVSSMHTAGEAPSFMAMIPPGSFSIERVYAKRTFNKRVSTGIDLEVVEVQDLILESVNDPNYNFKATSQGNENMASSHRLWWECKLLSQVVDQTSAAELQGVIDKMISQMDGVGFNNQGLWRKQEAQEVVEPEVPFW